jgi:hypothetical protein
MRTHLARSYFFASRIQFISRVIPSVFQRREHFRFVLKTPEPILGAEGTPNMIRVLLALGMAATMFAVSMSSGYAQRDSQAPPAATPSCPPDPAIPASDTS